MSQDKKNRLIYLITLSLLLSSLEYLIPKPFPFLKLGLANLPLIVSLPFLPFSEYMLLALSKSIIQSLVGGTIISPFFLISLSGTMATSLSMFLFYRLLKRNTFVGISVLGAIASNSAQLFMAATLIYGKSIFVAMPYIIGLGLISSTILGILANIFYRKSIFIDMCVDNSLLDISELLPKDDKVKKDNKVRGYIFVILAFSLIILSVLLKSFEILFAILLISYALQLLSGRKLKLVYPLVLFTSMVLLSLLEPNGKVIFKYFTDVSLKTAITKALRILILIASSQILVSVANNKIGFVKDIFAFSSVILEKFGKSKGSIINRLDNSIVGINNENNNITG